MNNFLSVFNEYISKNKLDYEIIGNSRSSVKLKHNCGFIFGVRMNDFIYKNKRCFKCEVEELTKGEFTVVSERKSNNRSEYIIQHKCGTKFITTRNKVSLLGLNCPHCNSLKKKKHYTLESAKQEVEEITNNEYTIISTNFKNSEQLITFKHLICGLEFSMSLTHFLRDGRRCPNCTKNLLRRNSDDVKKQILELTNSEIEILSDYKTWDTPMQFRHKSCGTIFTRTAKDMISNCIRSKRVFCPSCSVQSNGEYIIQKILDDNEVIYKYNKSISGCKLKSPLRFDFIIYEDNSIKAVIEFDGPQHTDCRRTFGSTDEDHFKNQVLRDTIKNNFCKENGILIIRISSSEIQDIENILSKNKII